LYSSPYIIKGQTMILCVQIPVYNLHHWHVFESFNCSEIFHHVWVTCTFHICFNALWTIYLSRYCEYLCVFLKLSIQYREVVSLKQS